MSLVIWLFLAWNVHLLTALDILNSKAFCEFICKSKAPSESVDHRESGQTRDQHQAYPGGTTLDGWVLKEVWVTKEECLLKYHSIHVLLLNKKDQDWGICSKFTSFFRCPSESKVGITPGILKCLQPSAHLALIHMD